MVALIRHTGLWESLLALLLVSVTCTPPVPALAGLAQVQSPQWQADDEAAPQLGLRQAQSAKNPLALSAAAMPFRTALLLATIIALSLRLFDANVAKRMKRLLLKPIKFKAIFYRLLSSTSTRT